MKILCMGCFHGKIPRGFKKFIKDNRIDAIFALGDYPGENLRPYYMKHFRDIVDEEGFLSLNKLRKVIGKKKVDALEKKDDEDGVKVLEHLNSLGIPVYMIYGNHDETKKHEKIRKVSKYALENTTKNMKDIHFLDYQSRNIEGFNIVFYGIKQFSKINQKRYTKYKWNRLINLRRKLRTNLNRLTNPPDSTIIVTHGPPYNTKLDVVNDKKNINHGCHFGDDILRKIIERKQPLMCISAHFHEHHRYDKIGKTKLVSCGYGREGQGAILELKEGKKPKVKLVRI